MFPHSCRLAANIASLLYFRFSFIPVIDVNAFLETNKKGVRCFGNTACLPHMSWSYNARFGFLLHAVTIKTKKFYNKYHCLSTIQLFQYRNSLLGQFPNIQIRDAHNHVITVINRNENAFCQTLPHRFCHSRRNLPI